MLYSNASYPSAWANQRNLVCVVVVAYKGFHTHFGLGKLLLFHGKFLQGPCILPSNRLTTPFYFPNSNTLVLVTLVFHSFALTFLNNHRLLVYLMFIPLLAFLCLVFRRVLFLVPPSSLLLLRTSLTPFLLIQLFC